MCWDQEDEMNDKTPSTFGEQLRTYRKRCRLTQRRSDKREAGGAQACVGRGKVKRERKGARAAGLDPATLSLAGADGKGGRSPWAAAAVRLRKRREEGMC